MTYLVDRLARLRTHLTHLRAIAPKVTSSRDLEADQSLQNDVLFSLLMVAQLVVDVSGELAARSGRTFGDYTEAVRALRGLDGFDDETVDALALLPGFRNVVVHEYVGLDLDVVVSALHGLDPVDRLIAAVAALES